MKDDASRFASRSRLPTSLTRADSKRSKYALSTYRPSSTTSTTIGPLSWAAGTCAGLRNVSESGAADGASGAYSGQSADRLGGEAPTHRPCLGCTGRWRATFIFFDEVFVPVAVQLLRTLSAKFGDLGQSGSVVAREVLHRVQDPVGVRASQLHHPPVREEHARPMLLLPPVKAGALYPRHHLQVEDGEAARVGLLHAHQGHVPPPR